MTADQEPNTRDIIAIAAMHAILPNAFRTPMDVPGFGALEIKTTVSIAAYEMADAMIKASQKGEKT